MLFSQSFSCPDCGISMDELEPQNAFPLTIPLAPARTAIGLGYKMEFDADLMIPDKSISIYQRVRSR